jgi:hypothetical protein
MLKTEYRLIRKVKTRSRPVFFGPLQKVKQSSAMEVIVIYEARQQAKSDLLHRGRN